MQVYIITTKRSTAVATPKEARDAASDVIQRIIETHIESDGFGMSAETQEPFFTAALNLPESGGTVGPLPDGTVIEVAPANWPDLIQATLDASEHNYPPLIWDTAEDRAEIIDAYNARANHRPARHN